MPTHRHTQQTACGSRGTLSALLFPTQLALPYYAEFAACRPTGTMQLLVAFLGLFVLISCSAPDRRLYADVGDADATNFEAMNSHASDADATNANATNSDVSEADVGDADATKDGISFTPAVLAWYRSDAYGANDSHTVRLMDTSGTEMHLDAAGPSVRIRDGAVVLGGPKGYLTPAPTIINTGAGQDEGALTIWLVVDLEASSERRRILETSLLHALSVEQDADGSLHFTALHDGAQRQAIVRSLSNGKQLIRMSVGANGELEAWVREEHRAPVLSTPAFVARSLVPTPHALWLGSTATDDDASLGKLWELVVARDLSIQQVDEITQRLETEHFAGYLALEHYTAWVDAADPHITVDAVTPALRSGFAASHAVLTPVTGPAGEPGISVAEADGVTAVHSVFADAGVANLAPGYVDVRMRIRSYDAIAQDGTGAHKAQRWRGPSFESVGSQAYSTFMWMLSPDERLNPLAPLSYRANEDRRRINAAFAMYDADWVDLRYEAHVNDLGTDVLLSNSFGLKSTGSITGHGKTVVDIASAEVRQHRVATYVDHRDGSSVFSEEDNAARLCLAPDLWMGHRPCFTEAWGSSSGATKLTSSATPAVVHAVAHFHNGRRVSVASSALTVGDVSLQVGSDARWHLVQNQSDVDTGIFVAPVPVVLTLAFHPHTVELWIDGVRVYTANLTREGSGTTILGGRGGGAVQAIAFDDTLEHAQIPQVAKTLRERAGLPPSWPLVVWTGQSNSVHDDSSTFHVVTNGIRSIPGHASLRAEFGTKHLERTEWRTGAFLDYEDPARTYKFGPSYGWLAAAQGATRPAVIVSCGAGGANLPLWLDGGSLYDYTRDEVDRSVSQFGTHLVFVDTFVFIQGEADSGYSELAAAYLERLRKVRVWMRAEWGEQVKWVGLRLNEFVGVNHPFADDVRAAQDMFAAEDPDTVYVTPDSDPRHFSDAVHYTVNAQRYVVGQPLFEARNAMLD